MTAAPKYDGRRARALEAELLRRAQAVLTGDGRNAEVGAAARAIIAVAARLEEEVTKRLDLAPTKQADNFYTAAGIGRDPARAAALPVAFALVDGATALTAPEATQLIASGAEPVVFETDSEIDLVPGRVFALRGLNAETDSISKPSDSVIEAELPRTSVVARRLLGGAGSGASKVQIDPAAGLKPGMLLSLGKGDDAREYVASAVEGNIVTLDPPLEAELASESSVREVAEFAPFAGTSRNYQTHALYLGHSTLLDLPSTATIDFSGAALPPEVEWSWWGKLTEDDDPAWQAFLSNHKLAKPAGKLVKTKINGQESLWLRAKLPGQSTEHVSAQDVRLAVGGPLCKIGQEARCPMTVASVEFSAIANTIPVVPNAPFQPFGREPRLYDSFYVGSDEAFAKAGADISLCFDFAGADLGPLVGQIEREKVFGVGTDGQLYVLQLNTSETKLAVLQSLPPPTNDKGSVLFKSRSPTAFDERLGLIAMVAKDDSAIYFADPQDLANRVGGAWSSVPLPVGTLIKSIAMRRDDSALLALAENEDLFQWSLPTGTTHPGGRRERVKALLPVENSGAVLLVIGSKPGEVTLLVEERSGEGPAVALPWNVLPEKVLGALRSGRDYYIAGYDARQGGEGYRLKLVVATLDDHDNFILPFAVHNVDYRFDEPLPIAFSLSPSEGAPNLPALRVATQRPTRVSWIDDSGDLRPKVEFEERSIGSSSNPNRRIYRLASYEIVQAPGVGLLFRQANEREMDLFRVAHAEWDLAGPKPASNPALSWEYWNGESWWALAAKSQDLTDNTFNFTLSGGVFFKVPKDIVPTEVVGKESYWIRARLIGGDYGEAEIKETDRRGIFTRDTSTIRAPTIVQLKIGYCALEPVLPELVLTEDNLGFIDQTSANVAGLEFSLFTPVSELMNPPSAAGTFAPRAADVVSCDDPCPEQSEDTPGPCDAPGAYDRPCLAPPGYRRPDSAEAEGFARAILVGFDEPFFGQTITLYIDAKPTCASTGLVAEIFQGGRFVRASVVSDSSFGLTEPGFLTLAFPSAPDESDLTGASSHWLRLRPKTNSALWAPVLRGIHLNAVMTHSVETHVRERLGASLAIEDQEFRLAGAPVQFDKADDIEIRVKEALGEEEIADAKLDTKADWVRWTAVDDLSDEADSKRIFVLDPNSGIIKFGDGRSGMIPPLGADVFAMGYKRVVGTNANGIEPGTQIPLLSPLAGVERTYALDYSAGGSDVEALESGRARAAVKLRHGGRILTPADLEDYARRLSPRIAQVRLETQSGSSRLIVAMRGATVQPSPADVRELMAAIREVAGFGVARKGALEIVAPRLLPLAIQLTLGPTNTDDFAEAERQAKNAIAALFDPATGNHDGDGWPIGRLPDEQDLAAALTKVEALALIAHAKIERADREVPQERALPATIPADVLVRVDWNDIDVQRPQEMAA